MRLATLAPLPLLAACAGTPDAPGPDAPARAAAPRIDAYAAKESDVNAYVVSDDRGAILIDATRNGDDATALLALARTTGHEPAMVVVTHGHPDHYWGLAALKAAIPGLRIVVATEAIKRDLRAFTAFAEGAGWPVAPGMGTGAFAYDAIEVLAEPVVRLPGGGALEVRTDFPAGEAEHQTALYSAAADALFTSDLAYEGVHLWMGPGVTREAAEAWRGTLETMERETAATTRVFPGHGTAPTDRGVFGRDRAYIADALAATGGGADVGGATKAMVEKYPEWKNRDFLLKMTVENLVGLAKTEK
jgi:glyoxylase-like metal-dependent hydrolase (beta-lactamase superfamily II)